MFHGLHHIGVELESRFVQLGQQNIDLWNRRYGNGKLRRWGTATILQGDSRRLCEVLEGARAEGIIASPPCAGSISGKEATHPELRNDGDTFRPGRSLGKPYSANAENLGNMPTGEPPQAVIGSPPYIDSVDSGQSGIDESKRKHARRAGPRSQARVAQCYGRSDGQLAAMREGEPPQAVIGSPPHSVNIKRDHTCEQRDKGKQGKGCFRGTYGSKADGQLAAMREGDVDAVIASPPYSKSLAGGGEAIQPRSGDVRKYARKMTLDESYGQSDGQLAAMREGGPPQVDGIVASPPYAKAQAHPSIGSVNKDGWGTDGRDIVARRGLDAKYGDSDGQLAALPEGEPPAGIVSSPPYEGSMNSESHGIDWSKAKKDYPGRLMHSQRTAMMKKNHDERRYGSGTDNLGSQQGDTFWAASRTILLQCHAVLAPGGVAIFVTKRFVRDKAIVDFSQQWADLCQSCGFELIEWIKAWLVEERGTQYDLAGEAHTKTIKHLSFFRRLHAQKYPHLAIEWEDVLIFRKLV